MLYGLHRRITRTISEPAITMIYAAIIGLGGGYGAVGFRKLIDYVTYLFYGRTQTELEAYTHGIRTLFMPAAGGLLVGLLVYFFAREAKGHGVPEVMFAITEKKGIIRPRIVIAKAIASALTIGSGGSVGREGPIVQIGSAWGSAFGQLFGVSEKTLKTLIACGAAAGIAGTFNAPIGGALFASEIILGSFAVTNVSAIVVSSVLSAAIGRFYLGNVPSFPIPHYDVPGISVLALFLVLGVIGGLYSQVYIRTLLFVETRWDRLHIPDWVKPVIGGLIVGAVGYFYPQILGVGYPSVEKALANHLDLSLLLTLLVLKLLMTSTTIASGGSGGVFAPGLYMGAMLGGAFGLICKMIDPGLPVSEGVFAVVGMAAVFAGTAHAPITAMIMLFEMTNNYQLILPLMLATVVSTTLSTKMFRESIYTMKLAKRGFDIIRKRSADRLSSILVGEALHPEHLSIVASMTLHDAMNEFENSKEWFAYVRSEKGQLLGSLSKTYVLEHINKGSGDMLIGDIVPSPPGFIRCNASIGEASQKMNDLGVQYLMALDQNSNPVGIIGTSDIVKAYRITG